MTLIVPTSTDWILELLVASWPKTYQPKQFILAIGSPCFPGITWTSTKASAKSVPRSKSMLPPDRCSFLKLDSSEHISPKNYLKLFWHCCMVCWLCVMVISTISETSDFLPPPARFIVKCVCGPLNPSFVTAALERRLVYSSQYPALQGYPQVLHLHLPL